jgi:hypothetical protein
VRIAISKFLLKEATGGAIVLAIMMCAMSVYQNELISDFLRFIL